MQKGKIVLLLLAVFLIPAVAGQTQQGWGTVRVDDCIELIQTCDNCTYVNITSILRPVTKEDLLGSESGMTQDGTEFNYTFCSNNVIGNYIVNGEGDPDGLVTVWAADYDVTAGGFDGASSGNYILIGLILIFSIGIMVIGFQKQEPIFVLFAGIVLAVFGLFVFNNGLGNFRNEMTQTVGAAILGISAFISIKTGIEMMQ